MDVINEDQYWLDFMRGNDLTKYGDLVLKEFEIKKRECGINKYGTLETVGVKMIVNQDWVY